MTKQRNELILDKEKTRFIRKSAAKDYVYDRARIEDILDYMKSRKLDETAPYRVFKSLLENLYASQ